MVTDVVRRLLMKSWKWLVVAGISAACMVFGIVHAATTDVFRVKATFQGGVQYLVITNEVSKVKTNGTTIYLTNEVVTAEIQDVVMNNADIINLAMGRDFGTKLPAGELLCITTQCGQGPIQWIVYNKDTMTIEATIGDFAPVVRAVGEKKSKPKLEETSILTILPTSNPTNAFVEGSLSSDVQSDLDTNGCMKNASISMIGWINTLISSNNYQVAPNPLSPVPIMVRKFTLKTQDSKPIDSIVIETP
jgi:hypothetical protein